MFQTTDFDDDDNDTIIESTASEIISKWEKRLELDKDQVIDLLADFIDTIKETEELDKNFGDIYIQWRMNQLQRCNVPLDQIEKSIERMVEDSGKAMVAAVTSKDISEQLRHVLAVFGPDEASKMIDEEFNIT